MSIGMTKTGDVLVATPPTRLDTVTAPETELVITKAVTAGEQRIVFDLGKTVYISSAGLRVILKISKLVAPSGGAVALCNANPQVREVLDISGFLTMLTYCSNLKEAIAKVAA
jgi:anti-sigma B factor antagonist